MSRQSGSGGPDDELMIAAGGDVVMAQELVWKLARHGDADVTVAVGVLLVDVYSVSYDRRYEKFVLHVHPDDLNCAARKLLGMTQLPHTRSPLLR